MLNCTGGAAGCRGASNELQSEPPNAGGGACCCCCGAADGVGESNKPPNKSGAEVVANAGTAVGLAVLTAGGAP